MQQSKTTTTTTTKQIKNEITKVKEKEIFKSSLPLDFLRYIIESGNHYT